MTTSHSRSLTYKLLKFVGHQPIQISRFVARLLAGLINNFHLADTAKSICLNLEIALPELSEAQREKITRNAIKNEMLSYFEFFSIWGSSTEKNLTRLHKVFGEHYFREALQVNKGLVLVIPHFGTWEIINNWCSQYTKMTILYKPVKDPGAELFVREARSREHAHLVPTDETGVREIFKALKQGGTTAILPDHTPNVGGDMVDYFGIPVASSNLSAKLIQKTKARALLVYALRNEDGGFDMYFEPMDEQIYAVSAEQGTRLIHQSIENLIQRYPEHYHWSYKRFKANPELAGIYNLSRDQAMIKIRQLKQHQHAAASVTSATADDSSVSV